MSSPSSTPVTRTSSPPLPRKPRCYVCVRVSSSVLHHHHDYLSFVQFSTKTQSLSMTASPATGHRRCCALSYAARRLVCVMVVIVCCLRNMGRGEAHSLRFSKRSLSLHGMALQALTSRRSLLTDRQRQRGELEAAEDGKTHSPLRDRACFGLRGILTHLLASLVSPPRRIAARPHRGTVLSHDTPDGGSAVDGGSADGWVEIRSVKAAAHSQLSWLPMVRQLL